MDTEFDLWVLSSMPKLGPTGVQTFVANFQKMLQDEDISSTFLNIRDVSPAAHFLVRATAIAFARSPCVSFAIRRILTTTVASYGLRRKLRRHVGPVVLCAQDPGLAHAAIRAIRASDLHSRAWVVLVAHFNRDEYTEALERTGKRQSVLLRSVLNWNARNSFRHANLVIFPSHFAKDQVMASGTDVEAPHTVITNFLNDTPRYIDCPQDRVVLSIGTLERRKNQRETISIVAEAAKAGATARLVVVGDGDDRAELEALAASVPGGVDFVGNELNAAARLANARVLLHSAWVENMPLTLIEALAHGRPIIARRTGGIPEIVTDGVEGFLYDTPTQAASALNLLLLDDDLWREMSIKAREKFQSLFSNRAARSAWGQALAEMVRGAQDSQPGWIKLESEAE